VCFFWNGVFVFRAFSLIHRSDPKLYLYGGERMEIARIGRELIEVLISLWKVGGSPLVAIKPSLNRF